jgi:rSAM/selenodomain-associated transferase 2
VHLTRRFSVIIPVLNEAAGLSAFLEDLQWIRKRDHELILVDGGSGDATTEIAHPLVDRIIISRTGRSHQMNRGADVASGDVLLFLHADTQLPDQALSEIEAALDSGSQWGRFDVRLSGDHSMLCIIERMMNWRSSVTGIATGDQAIFVMKTIFYQAGAFPEIALMEDIELSRRLKRFGRPACIKPPVITSSRRWEQGGIFATVLLMWRLRLAYFLGASPEDLAKRYRQSR